MLAPVGQCPKYGRSSYRTRCGTGPGFEVELNRLHPMSLMLRQDLRTQRTRGHDEHHEKGKQARANNLQHRSRHMEKERLSANEDCHASLGIDDLSAFRLLTNSVFLPVNEAPGRVMSNDNLYAVFSERFVETDTFIRSPDGSDLYSYADLDHYSAVYADRLKVLGAVPGDRIMVQMEKSSSCLFLYFACLRGGFVYLPLNTAYQPEELAYFAENAEPAVVVTSPLQKPVFEGFAQCPVETLDPEGHGSFSDQLPDSATGEIVSRSYDDLAAILYTSGTTGKPKGAMLSHGNLTSNAKTLHALWGFVPGDVLLHALPIFHVHGLFVATNVAVFNGSTLLFFNKFDAASVVNALPTASVYMGVPTNYTRMLSEPSLDRSSCANMRLFISGSAPLLTQTFRDFETRTDHTILERYGMTETGMNTSNPLVGVRKPGTVGPPLPGVDIRIVDDSNQTVTDGETGNLLVTGPNVFSGYWRMPEKNLQEFSDGYFRTGDLASRDEDGYISIVGRSKDLIITGGLNVYPKEVESVIDRMEGVNESAVIGVPHADFGEAVTAVVVLDDGSSISENDVVAHLKSTLANFKVAKQVHFVNELPRNAMGKVQKNLLRDEHDTGVR